MKAKRAIIYVDDETLRLDLASITVDSGVVLEIRRWCKDGIRRFADPVVAEVTASGTTYVNTKLET